MTGKRAFGDFQTPKEFTEAVCRFLQERYAFQPELVLEPTCGIGNFLKSSLCFNAQDYIGIEINTEYCQLCTEQVRDDRLKIINDNFFDCDLEQYKRSNTLIIGNPPWVNNSTLSILQSDNLPKKSNFKGLRGINAITGEGNFDICEYIILRLISTYRNTDSLLAMLCKTSVARNVFQELKRQKINFSGYTVFEFDAKKVFDISAGACLLVVRLSDCKQQIDACNVYDFSDFEHIKYAFGYRDNLFYSNLAIAGDDFEGDSCFEWRQGVKHDCSKVMELSCVDGCFINGFKEKAAIEDALVFPLVKSSKFKTPIVSTFSKYVIVTQKKVQQDTSYIEQKFPETWKYLSKYRANFTNRKSSIYKNSPPFSMFGIGDYSYSQYKVGISGFYKEPLFSVLYSADGKPVMTDDTAYFICLPNYDAAYVAMLYLNSDRVVKFLKSIAFLDAKRPYTKKVLSRIDFAKITNEISVQELQETESRLGLDRYLTKAMVKKFKSLLEIKQQNLFE